MPSPPPGAKGRLTIRTAAVLFLLSAVVELISIRAPAPWFGVLRGGGLIVFYHLAFVTLFLAMGVGLWTGARWGLWMVSAGTAVYTADRIRYLLDRSGRAAEILAQLHTFAPDTAEVLDIDALLRLSTVMTALFISCWVGFAAYIYIRRGYFR